MEYNYTVTLVRKGYDAYQSNRVYSVKTDCFELRICHWGNQGWGSPAVSMTSRSTDAFNSLNTFMRAFYRDELYSHFSNMQEGEERSFTLERYF